MKRIVELDGVRTLAVASVISAHYAPFSNYFYQIPAQYGGLGVDVFFVLSGFLITTILLELKHSEHPYKIFYARRFLRIMPPYLLLLAIVYGIAYVVHDPIEPKKVIGQLLFLRSFVSIGVDVHHLLAIVHHPHLIPSPFARTFHKFIAPDMPVMPITAALGPTWSLSVEEWFYVLWAPVVLLLRRSTVLGVAIGMCVVGFLLRWFISPAAMIVRSADILIVGALLALWISHRKTLPAPQQRRYDRLLAVASVFATFLYIALALLGRELMSITIAEVVFAGLIAWLIRSTGSPNLFFRFLRLKPMVYVGSISYTLYLIHLPMYFLVRPVIVRMAGNMNEQLRMWIVAVVSITLSLIFSAISWKYYEAPILNYKDHVTDLVTGKARLRV